MAGQFGRQHALGQHLLELAGKARLAESRLGILILDLGQQLVDQLNRERSFFFLGFLVVIASLMEYPFRYYFMTPLHTKMLTGSRKTKSR